MVSERIQRRIDALLDEADEAFTQRDWRHLRELADDVLKLDEASDDAKTYLAAADKEFEFVDRGEVSLKGFDEPVRAWSVEW